MDTKTIRSKSLSEALDDELLETIDEELELEFDDQRLDSVLGPIAPAVAREEALDRRTYFRELLRLQRELIKLQDWVVHQKLKLVVLFEGRDAAGKGGVIKRITQRLNPRVCKVVALSAPTERERTQWYFQRYVSHLPAAGEIVLFDRSWYNRAGVERVMGFCSEADCEEFFRTVPEFEGMLVRSGIILLKYWFSITDQEQNMRFLIAHPRPAQAVEAQPHGPRIASAMGAVYQGQGGDDRAHPHSGITLVGRGGGRQEEGAAELHSSFAAAGALSGSSPRSDHAARSRAQAGLFTPPRTAGFVCSGSLLARRPHFLGTGTGDGNCLYRNAQNA